MTWARAIGILALTALVAGCGARGSLLQGYSNTSVEGTDGERAAAAQRFAAAAQQGAPLIQVGIDKTGANTLAYLETRRRGIDTYMTPDGIAILLSDSVLFGTKGLSGDLMASDVRQSSAAIRSRGAAETTRFHTFLNGEDQAETRTYRCILQNSGAREIQVSTLAGEFQTLNATLLQEDCSSLTQDFSNLYWVAPGSGRILQSRQWAGETTEYLVLRIVLP